MLRAALVVIPLLLTAVDARPAPSPEQVVSKVISAYGGRRALAHARIVKQEGTVTSLMRGGEGRMVRLFARPDSLRVEISYPGDRPEVRVLHHGRGERDGTDVTGTPAYGAMVLQAARLALPLSLADRGAHVEDRGEIERGGRRARVLALSLPAGMEVVAEIDPVTYRIVRSSGTMPVPGDRIEFATEYSDFKKVGGVLFATHEENYARGHHTGATRLARIEILEKVPEGAFDESL